MRKRSLRIGRHGSPLLAAVLLVAACTSNGDPPRQDQVTSVSSMSPSFDPKLGARLSRALEIAVADSGAPGAQAAVVMPDGSLWTAGAGLSTQDQRMTPDLLTAIASITKLYTVALTLDLAQDGLLSLDDPLERWVPGVPNAEGVTVRQLLTHTSGLASDDPALPPVCDPGACYSYSGAFSYLGQVIEKASGKAYATALRERILAPAGLSATFFPPQETAVGDAASGYVAGEAKSAVDLATEHDRPAWEGAGGDMVATAADIARFANALFTGSALDQPSLDELLDFEAIRGLPGTSDCMGEGMSVLRHSGDFGESWFAGGLAGYFRSWVEHYPGQRVTVAVVVNADVPMAAFVDGLAREALADAPVVRSAVRSDRCNVDIAVRAADGTVRQVTSDAGFDGFPSWSPDGQRLVWIGSRNGQNDVFVTNVDGAELVRLTDDAAHDLFPRWSPDGTAIAFSSDRDGDQEIYLAAPDGSDVRQLTDNDWDEWLPTWSPDGSQLAYVSANDGQHVRVMAADGSGDRAVTGGEGREWWPAWSPDGRRIAYESNGVIFIVPVAGGEPVRLPIPQIRVTTFPAWAPGADIVFSSDADLYATAEDGTNLRRLTATSTEEGAPAWSPDGSQIAFQLSHWETPDQ